jgi:Holliday junction resolvasome RuvABC endonuclease subunit
MNDPIVLGVDPGFASFGWSIVKLSSTPEVLAAGVIRTKKATKLQKTLASDDNVVRAREIYNTLQLIIESQPQGKEIQAICAEAMSWPRNAGAAAKVAIAWGVLAAVAEETRMSLLQASPQAVKKAMTGRRDASKDEIKVAVWNLTLKRSAVDAVGATKLPAGCHEHMYDSIAVALTCADSDVVRLLRRAA